MKYIILIPLFLHALQVFYPSSYMILYYSTRLLQERKLRVILGPRFSNYCQYLAIFWQPTLKIATHTVSRTISNYSNILNLQSAHLALPPILYYTDFKLVLIFTNIHETNIAAGFKQFSTSIDYKF